jgi:glycerate-2-kinase
MGFIKNFDTLATTPERKVLLDLIEAGLHAIQPKQAFQSSFVLTDSTLSIKQEQFNLKDYQRVFFIGFGKGSGGIAKMVEETLGDYLTDGYVIDNVQESFSKLHFTLGTHPLPSQQNLDFTKSVLKNIHNLTEKDLVLVVICGGGSALFEAPFAATLEQLENINKQLLHCGANISEMNVIRKHMSLVKGGGLGKHLYPATVRSLIFSDVPGNDVAVIASGPTTQDHSTMEDVHAILTKYNLSLPENLFTDLPHEPKYFEHVVNSIMVSNQTALQAMKKTAEEQGVKVHIYSDKFQGDAKEVGKDLIDQTTAGEILLVGGETTLHVKGNGKGGRNQTLVTAALPYVDQNVTIASIDTDGVDFFTFAGAIGDFQTVQKAQELNLSPQAFLDEDNTYEFLEQVGDGILTDKLESNVSDVMLVLKK